MCVRCGFDPATQIVLVLEIGSRSTAERLTQCASRIGPQRARVIPARLRRFRLGADWSPAPSAQALQSGRSDARPCGRLRRDPIRAAFALFGVGCGGVYLERSIVLVLVLVLEITSRWPVRSARGQVRDVRVACARRRG